MPIVFDQVEAVVQPTSDAPEPPAEGAAGDNKDGGDVSQIQLQLERVQRRQRRLLAD